MRVLLFLALEGRDTYAGTDFGRRMEQRWAYYFLRRGEGHTRRRPRRPARRAEAGLLFLAQEGTDTHAGTYFGRRVEQRRAYYILRRGEGHTPAPTTAGA